MEACTSTTSSTSSSPSWCSPVSTATTNQSKKRIKTLPHATITNTACHYSQDITFRSLMFPAGSQLHLSDLLHCLPVAQILEEENQLPLRYRAVAAQMVANISNWVLLRNRHHRRSRVSRHSYDRSHIFLHHALSSCRHSYHHHLGHT